MFFAHALCRFARLFTASFRHGLTLPLLGGLSSRLQMLNPHLQILGVLLIIRKFTPILE
jgi:hypothetical protein